MWSTDVTFLVYGRDVTEKVFVAHSQMPPKKYMFLIYIIIQHQSPKQKSIARTFCLFGIVIITLVYGRDILLRKMTLEIYILVLFNTCNRFSLDIFPDFVCDSSESAEVYQYTTSYSFLNIYQARNWPS
jgi:hypothetical protein